MQEHHSYLTRAASLFVSSVPEAYKTPSIDVLHVVRDRFSIDDAREVSSQAQMRPFEAFKRVFVLVAQDIAVEAQNALLKLLEEPPAHALFYVVIPQTVQLLPTLASRLAFVPSEASFESSDAFSAFMDSSYAERLSAIAERTKEKDAVWIESILAGCEKTASAQSDETLLRSVIFARSYVKTKGASVKMLLEDVALLLKSK
jgi:DNA polymerase III delta prime subunit